MVSESLLYQPENTAVVLHSTSSRGQTREQPRRAARHYRRRWIHTKPPRLSHLGLASLIQA